MKTFQNIKFSDEQLVEALVEGNIDAMSELYARYHNVVLQKCLSYSRNSEDAADLSQDIFLRAFEKIKSFRHQAKFSTWLFSIANNYCTDFTRKSSKRHFDTLKEINYNVPDNFELFEDREQEIMDQTDFLNEMEGEDIQILILKYQKNKSIRDIQSIYNISASAVKMRLLRARQRASNQYGIRKSIAA